MSFGTKFAKFVNDNIVMITVIPLLVGIHWTWSKLQDVPELVPPSDKKELPIITGAMYLEGKVMKEFHHVTGSSENEEKE